MKRAIAIGIVLTLGTSQALAVPGVCTPGLSGNAIAALVLNKYVCDGVFPNVDWNEFHNGSTITDYKKGPSDPKDPSTVVGSYTTTASSAANGVITYTYTGGSSTYAYNVKQNSGTSYFFCPTGAGANLTLNVQASHC
jgi:hypothetical protein